MAADTSSYLDCSTSKSIIVRIKRKRLQDPVGSLWVEVSARPAKRPELDLSSLSLHDGEGPMSRDTTVETRSTKLLFRHLETITSFGAEETSRVETLLKNAGDEKGFRKWKERRQVSTRKKDYHGAHLTTARMTHEALAKAARFEQVWRSRNDPPKDDIMSEFFHLYDVVQVDAEVNVADKHQSERQAKREAELADNQLLHNYLPLLRDFLPTAATQLESELPSQSTKEDEYVYDVYALEEGADGSEADNADYPMVHLIDGEDCGWGSSDSQFDSEDSNDENNPRNDYPEEEDSDFEIESDAEEGTSESDSEIGDEELLAKDDGSEECIDISDEYEEYYRENDYDSADENE